MIRDISLADFEENDRVNAAAIALIDRGLTQYNRETRPDNNALPLVLVIEEEQIIGGLLGRSAYGWMRIDILWVESSCRGKGYGLQLMQEVEKIAIERGCHGLHLDTHGFQAPNFYMKLGFEIFGELEDYPKGESHYYLKKKLSEAAHG